MPSRDQVVHRYQQYLDAGNRRDQEAIGAHVETDEFNPYRAVDGLIVELEGTADSERLCR